MWTDKSDADPQDSGPRRQHGERKEHRGRHQDAGCKPQLDSSFAV